MRQAANLLEDSEGAVSNQIQESVFTKDRTSQGPLAEEIFEGKSRVVRRRGRKEN